MESGIVLMKADPDHAPDIAEKMSHLPGVNHIYVADGDHQLVAIVAGKTHDDLSALIDRHLAKTEGVEVSERLTTRREYSRLDLESERIGFGP